MDKEQKIEGKFSSIDISDYPIDLTKARNLVDYFDDKYPRINELLKVHNYPEKVFIFTRKDDCYAQKFDYNKIKFTPNPKNQNYISDGNKGFLIHEAVHIIQNYTNQVYQQNHWVSEAMADYVRVRLGWDNVDRPDEYPCGRHNDLGCSKCDAAFLFWLEKNYSDPNLISDINKALKNKENIDNFFYQRLKKNISILYKEVLENFA